MVNYRSFLLLAVTLLVVVSAGCDQSASPSNPTTAPAGSASAKPRVALVMKSLANEFFKTMQDGAEADQKAHAGDYELLSTGIKNETDVADQISLVEGMVAQHVNAIVIAPADSKALVPACQKATAAGIVVINIDNKLDSDALKEKAVTVPFVGPNNMK